MGQHVLSTLPATTGGDPAPVAITHRHCAHCESGVTANLLSHHGLPLNEAMAFGIGAGLFFAYMPFLRVGSLPLTTYRTMPGLIFKRATRRLGVTVERQRFKHPQEATEALDRMLDRGIPVGCQTSVYWLPYFPSSMRFHFNAHHIIIYGRQGEDYLVSDPIVEHPTVCPRRALLKARFAAGPLAPHGLMYHVASVPRDPDLKAAVIGGLRDTCRAMSVPVPFGGYRGVRLLARRMATWPQRLGPEAASQCLGNVIRMQEEIGTGGGGFRFIFAAFLQQASELFHDERLAACSEHMTLVGDQWREFALQASRYCKGRSAAVTSTADLAAIVEGCADAERAVIKTLAKITPTLGRRA